MIVHHCDRCHKEIPKNKEKEIVHVAIYTSPYTEEDKVPKELCRDCGRAFSNLMRYQEAPVGEDFSRI